MRRPSDGATGRRPSPDRAPCAACPASQRPSWSFEPPPDDHPEDLWALGADLEPGTLLAAYRSGLFPMPIGPRLGWFSPRRRGIVALDSFAPSRSLRRAARGFEIRVDTAFADVVAGCARPGDPQSWIDERDRDRLLPAPRARVGALRRGVGRRGARRRALRRLDRWPVRGGVDVPRADRRLEGRVRRARRAPARRRRRRSPHARRAVAHGAPRHRSARSRSPRADYRVRLADTLDAAAGVRRSASSVRKVGRCRS